jgi:hypothetical protein
LAPSRGYLLLGRVISADSQRLGVNEKMKARRATSRLFQIVAGAVCGKVIVENASQMANAVVTQRTFGIANPARAVITIATPTSQLLVWDARVCGQAKAEMHNHAPTVAFRIRGHGPGGRVVSCALG